MNLATEAAVNDIANRGERNRIRLFLGTVQRPGATELLLLLNEKASGERSGRGALP